MTATGKVIIPAQPNGWAAHNGFLELAAYVNDPCGITHSCNVTATDSLGSSVTVTIPPAGY